MPAPKGNENRAKVKGEKRVMVSYRLSLATIALMKAWAEANGKEQAETVEMAILKMCH
jgi:hypothetical protein